MTRASRRCRSERSRPVGASDRARRIAGLSYVEVLIAIAILALALVPAIEGLSGSLDSSSAYTDRVAAHYHAMGKLEDVLSESFDELDREAQRVGSANVVTAYSDAAATARRRLVYLAAWDGDNADGDNDPLTGGDPGLLWVRVEIENTERSLEALTTP